MPNKPPTDAHLLSPEVEADLRGCVVEAGDPIMMDRAIDLALDYRGDITVTLTSNAVVEGYLFDRRVGPSRDLSVIRIMPQDGGENRAIAYTDIATLEFTGRDTAAGKSFETWMRKYVEKKLAGEVASIESDPLDDEGDAP